MKIGFLFFIALCCDRLSFAQSLKNETSKKFVIGTVDTIQSGILGEKRIVNIYLPDDYSPDAANGYPVIYLLDGGADEDFVHIVGLVKYFTTSWVNRFSPSIVVGIENVNRRRDFTFATSNLDFVTKTGFDKNSFPQHGGSPKFIAFIEKELQPFIQSHYKTNASKTIIGESLGGLLATEILLKNPSLFNTYIIISPSLWWGDESLLAETPALIKRSSRDSIKIYVGAAKKSEDGVMYRDAQNLALLLKKYEHQNISVSFDYLANETHATIIHQAVYNAFKLLNPEKK